MNSYFYIIIWIKLYFCEVANDPSLTFISGVGGGTGIELRLLQKSDACNVEWFISHGVNCVEFLKYSGNILENKIK